LGAHKLTNFPILYPYMCNLVSFFINDSKHLGHILGVIILRLDKIRRIIARGSSLATGIFMRKVDFHNDRLNQVISLSIQNDRNRDKKVDTKCAS